MSDDNGCSDLGPRHLAVCQGDDPARYGSNAGIEAAERANDHMEGGDEQSGQTWVRAMQAIERLQAEKPEPGETVQ